jgi:hypothetical protein
MAVIVMNNSSLLRLLLLELLLELLELLLLELLLLIIEGGRSGELGNEGKRIFVESLNASNFRVFSLRHSLQRAFTNDHNQMTRQTTCSHERWYFVTKLRDRQSDSLLKNILRAAIRKSQQESKSSLPQSAIRPFLTAQFLVINGTPSSSRCFESPPYFGSNEENPRNRSSSFVGTNPSNIGLQHKRPVFVACTTPIRKFIL